MTFANDFKHRHIIYCWKEFFTMIMNSILLPQNKVPFGPDPLAKFALFAQKCVQTIRVLSLGMESTILKSKLT